MSSSPSGSSGRPSPKPSSSSSKLPSSSPKSSPSRQLLNEYRRTHLTGALNGYHSPSRHCTDSPSRQLHEEISRLWIDEDKAFQKQLDQQAHDQEKRHREALERSRLEHEKIRENAERARLRLELQIKQDKERREEEERAALEKVRKDLVEQEAAARKAELERAEVRAADEKRKASEEQQLVEANKRVEEQRKHNEEEAKRRKAAQDKEDTERKVREDEAARARQAQALSQAQVQKPQTNGVNPAQPASAPIPAPPASSAARVPPTANAETREAPIPASTAGVVSTAEEREAEHKRYLELHQRLKEMRAFVTSECKKIPGFDLSDLRRNLRRSASQLTRNNSLNGETSKDAFQTLRAAASLPGPKLDLAPFVISTRSPDALNGIQISGILLFLVNHLAKAIINQFCDEASRGVETADAVGVFAVKVFALPEFNFNGYSLIDVLWAKYHKVCPTIFGISGNEKTERGRQRLAWQKEDDGWVKPQFHYERQTGLAAGYAAITLRDFSKSKSQNPAPNRLFWQAMSRIMNTPPAELQPTHYIVLKAMIDPNAGFMQRFIKFFGQPAIVALRQAILDFPYKAPFKNAKGELDPVPASLAALAVVVQRDLKLSLTPLY